MENSTDLKQSCSDSSNQSESGKTETAEKTPKKKTKKKKVKYIDDGHTVYSMEGLDGGDAKKKKDKADLTRKERNAVIRAAFAVYLPIFLGVIVCFTIALLVTYIWFH